jgi:hypothetical protein
MFVVKAVHTEDTWEAAGWWGLTSWGGSQQTLSPQSMAGTSTDPKRHLRPDPETLTLLGTLQHNVLPAGQQACSSPMMPRA